MGGWSGNKISRIWKKLQMLPMRMFLINLTQCGVWKVLLLFVAICRLLERLEPMWALFLESAQFCDGSPKVTCTFPLQWNLFTICARKEEEG
jgi:hypothetical protein